MRRRVQAHPPSKRRTTGRSCHHCEIQRCIQNSPLTRPYTVSDELSGQLHATARCADVLEPRQPTHQLGSWDIWVGRAQDPLRALCKAIDKAVPTDLILSCTSSRVHLTNTGHIHINNLLPATLAGEPIRLEEIVLLLSPPGPDVQ